MKPNHSTRNLAILVADFFMYAGRGLDPRVQGFVEKQLAKEKLPIGLHCCKLAQWTLQLLATFYYPTRGIVLCVFNNISINNVS